jgi:hypothetical protein
VATAPLAPVEARLRNAWEHPMLDLILLSGMAIVFVLTIAYAYACDWL